MISEVIWAARNLISAQRDLKKMIFVVSNPEMKTMDTSGAREQIFSGVFYIGWFQIQ